MYLSMCVCVCVCVCECVWYMRLAQLWRAARPPTATEIQQKHIWDMSDAPCESFSSLFCHLSQRGTKGPSLDLFLYFKWGHTSTSVVLFLTSPSLSWFPHRRGSVVFKSVWHQSWRRYQSSVKHEKITNLPPVSACLLCVFSTGPPVQTRIDIFIMSLSQ